MSKNQTSNRTDITGQRFGRLIAQRYSHTRDKRAYWICLCDCGNEKAINGHAIRGGKTISCGCKFSEVMIERNKTHGLSHLGEYRIWSAMRERCRSPRHIHYERYGARGISVCNGWNKDFKSFYDDLGPRPLGRYSIDRIDNEKGYTCGHCDECKDKGWKLNCRWSNDVDQANNRCNSITVTHNGREMLLVELSQETGIPYTTLYQRHRKGKPLTP